MEEDTDVVISSFSEPSTKKELFTIRIHNILTEAHNAHGLRHSDFHQYHTYCTNRLSRLRHHKPVRKELSYSATGYKASSSSSTLERVVIKGGRHAFHPRGDFDDNTLSSHVNFTLVYLYESERAWAHAMELKDMYDTMKIQLQSQLNSSGDSKNRKGTTTTTTTESSDKNQSQYSLTRSSEISPGSVRRHYIQRLKKACKHVDELESCTQRTCDERTRAECFTYKHWIYGTFYFEVGQWEVCIAYIYFFCSPFYT